LWFPHGKIADGARKDYDTSGNPDNECLPISVGKCAQQQVMLKEGLLTLIFEK
jgi:hypothetical protein